MKIHIPDLTAAREHAADHANLLFYGNLGLCGCGCPEDAFKLIGDLLALMPLYDDQRWVKADALIGSPGAAHIVLSHLEENGGLIEHGSSIGGSWLTDKGRYFQGVLLLLDWDHDVDGPTAGMPGVDHDCDLTCWQDTSLLTAWLTTQAQEGGVRVDRFTNAAGTSTRATHLSSGLVVSSGSEPLSRTEADAAAARALLTALRRAEL